MLTRFKIPHYLAQFEEKWQPYYQGLLEREKRLLMAAAVALPLMIVVFGMILPLHDAQLAKQQQLLLLNQQVQEAEALAKALQKQGAPVEKGNTMTVVDQTARKVHVREFITRLRPQMGQGSKQRLLIQMRNVPYSLSVRFFTALSKQGLNLLQVKLQQAKEAGFVHVQLVVE